MSNTINHRKLAKLYDHLNECELCKKTPLKPCAIGAMLLKSVVKEQVQGDK